MKSVIKAIALFLLMASPCVLAAPIGLSPGDEAYNGDDCGGCGPGLPKILSWLDANVAGFDSNDESYKSDEDGDALGTDSGLFAHDYSTTFMNVVGDPGDATISWDGGDFLTGAEWLLVKDGGNTPIWYLFDLTGWDGMMDINLTGFWPGPGSISHVSIWGGERTAVPEPGTLALLGFGLAALGLSRRRRTS